MKVSFIVPIYNVTPYIEECARSLFNQTLESCEFIFVDDCSTDNSSELLMELITSEFSQMQDRITLIRHASNLGASEARNTALKVAKGNFVIFIDGDDWVDPELAEELAIEQLVNNADLVSSNYYKVKNGSKNHHRSPYIGGRTGSLHLLASQSFAIENRIWGTLIRRSLICDNSITFDPNITMGEDFLFLIQLLYHAERIAHVSDPLYFYRTDNSSSAMHNISQSQKDSYIAATEQVTEFLTTHSTENEFRTTLYLLRWNLKRWQIMRSGHTLTPYALLIRSKMLILNSIHRLRWQLLAK